MFRKIVTLRLEEITHDKLVSILNDKPLGLLMLLPNIAQKDLGKDLENAWTKIQDTLASHRINIPIYFATENEENLRVYEDLKAEFNKSKTKSN